MWFEFSNLPKADLDAGAFLHIWLKQSKFPYMGTYGYLSETLFSLENIPITDHGSSIDGTGQTKLPLSKPVPSKYLNALEQRKYDDLAKAFVKTQKLRFQDSSTERNSMLQQ